MLHTQKIQDKDNYQTTMPGTTPWELVKNQITNSKTLHKRNGTPNWGEKSDTPETALSISLLHASRLLQSSLALEKQRACETDSYALSLTLLSLPSYLKEDKNQSEFIKQKGEEDPQHQLNNHLS